MTELSDMIEDGYTAIKLNDKAMVANRIQQVKTQIAAVRRSLKNAEFYLDQAFDAIRSEHTDGYQGADHE